MKGNGLPGRGKPATNLVEGENDGEKSYVWLTEKLYRIVIRVQLSFLVRSVIPTRVLLMKLYQSMLQAKQ